MKLEVELVQVKSIGEFCNSLNEVVAGHAFWFKDKTGRMVDLGTRELSRAEHEKFKQSIENGLIYRRVLPQS